MKILSRDNWVNIIVCVISLAIIPSVSFGGKPTNRWADFQEQYLAVPLAKNSNNGFSQKIVDRYGVPFIEGTLPVKPGGSARVNIGGEAKRIFLLGMTDSANTRCWADPRDYSARFFIGDNLGEIRLDYVDGSTQVFPLIMGEGVWWGQSFYKCPEPFLSNARVQKTFADALRLYPPMPVEDGNYIAVIAPKPVAIRSITIKDSPAKKGTVVIDGITIESAETNGILGMLC